MSFLGGPFKHDLFVSYSYGQRDQDDRSSLEDWCDAFVRQLDQELRFIPRFRDVSIFVDVEESPNQSFDPTLPLTDQLKVEIAKSALLLVLMTPQYAASRRSSDARDHWFQSIAKDGLGEEGRVFVARVLPTDTQDWPIELKDSRGEEVLGFLFYEGRDPGYQTRPFSWPDPTDAGGPFRATLLTLVGYICQHLDTLSDKLVAHRAVGSKQKPLLTSDLPKVYLHAPETDLEALETVKQSLLDSEYAVFPKKSLETQGISQELDLQTDAMRRQAHIRALADCDALLILGTESNDTLETDLFRDLNSARYLSGKPLPVALLNKTVTPEAKGKQFGIEVIDGREETWPDIFTKWLSDTQQREAIVSKSRIFLAHASEDKPQVRKLYRELKECGFDPWLDEFDLMPGQIWKDEIPKAIAGAGIFLACLSAKSVGKVGYIQNEFRRALIAFGERPPGSIYLIPVRLDECEVPNLRNSDLDISLKDFQWVDLFDEGGRDRLISTLRSALPAVRA